jgi:hypothetical protein
MSQRITANDLRRVVTRINTITGNPTEPYAEGRQENGNLIHNVGNFDLSSGYGGWKLVQVSNVHGGERDPLSTGFIKPSELRNLMFAFIEGFYYAPRAPKVRATLEGCERFLSGFEDEHEDGNAEIVRPLLKQLRELLEMPTQD